MLVDGEEVEEDVVLRAHPERLPDGVHVRPGHCWVDSSYMGFDWELRLFERNQLFIFKVGA